ncbi:MAG: cytochrome oxidase small assembly protein [Betaproteobacteria bacterium]
MFNELRMNQNKRTGLILASIALAFFIGFLIRRWMF